MPCFYNNRLVLYNEIKFYQSKKRQTAKNNAATDLQNNEQRSRIDPMDFKTRLFQSNLRKIQSSVCMNENE